MTKIENHYLCILLDYPKMNVPAYLNIGDKIAIISTARKVTIEDVYPAIELFKSWGLEPILGPNLFETDNQFAGTDQERAYDLVWAFQSSEINAIICARGGYGTARIIDKFDHKILQANPKWLVGFSDVTVLLSLLANHQIPSIHGIMPLLFKQENVSNSVNSLKDALFGKPISLEVPSNESNKLGVSEGVLIGGNLSILNNLIGTIADFQPKGKILFLEDLDEYYYHIDRMILHLKMSNKLNDLSGLIIGHFSDLRDNNVPFGKSIEEIILEAVREYDYPVCFNFPTGHQFDNISLKVGMVAKLEVSQEKVTFYQM
jgi:muramoyltetrapeptide carboxypeptidase